MAIYVVLGRLTHKAIADIKGIADRDRKGEEVIRAAGGKLLAHYYTFGRYDFVVILEVPTPEAMVKILVEIGKWGTVSTETLSALPPELVYRATTGN
jgi:uncharacterized protein with GYD domain